MYDSTRVIKQFLDANAHVPLSFAAQAVYEKYDSNSLEANGHPSSLNLAGRKAAILLEDSREKIANLIGAKSKDQIIFTSGCTQAAEWGISILDSIEPTKKYSISYSPIEHTAVRDPIENLSENKKEQFELLPVDEYGIVSFPENSEKVICIHAHNEFGSIQYFGEKKWKYLFSDMSQSLGKIPINVTESDIDIAVFGAHKFGGPVGVGFMYLKEPEWWIPFGSGGRYYMDKSGTPDVIGVIATAAALQEATDTLQIRMNNMDSFKEELDFELISRDAKLIPSKIFPFPKKYPVTSMGSLTESILPNTTFFKLEGKALDKMLKMSERGIYFGLGSACGAGHTGISQSLRAIGENGNIQDYARISQWGQYNADDAKDFIEIFDSVG